MFPQFTSPVRTTTPGTDTNNTTSPITLTVNPTYYMS